MADIWLEQQLRARDLFCHEQDIFAFDRLVVVAIDNPDRHFDGVKLLRGEVWLARPHLGDFIQKLLVLIGRWRKTFILPPRARDKAIKDRALVDILNPARIGIRGEGEEFCYVLWMMNGDVEPNDRAIAPADNGRLRDLQKVHEPDDIGCHQIIAEGLAVARAASM